MQKRRDVLGALDVWTIDGSESSPGALETEAVLKFCRIKRDRIVKLCRVPKRTQAHLQDRACTLVEWEEIAFINRPAAVRNPRSFAKVQLIELRAAAAPVIGRAAEKTKAGEHQLGFFLSLAVF